MLDSDIDDRLYHALIGKQFSLDNILHMKDPVRVEIELAEEFNLRGGEIAMAAMVRVSCPAPEQNEHLPYRIEMMSQAAGLQFMRKFFGLAIEKADLELFVSL